MKVGYIQFKPKLGKKKQNQKKILDLIKIGEEADLLVLPELCNTGYLFDSKDSLRPLAEKVDNGSSIQQWKEISKATDTYLVAGFAELGTDDKLYNSSVLISPDGEIDVYRKIHLFFKEKLLFSPGNELPKIHSILNSKISMIICFDWVFPELTRYLSLNGLEILCHPANLVLPFAQRTMLARSIENRIFTITANRTGTDSINNEILTFTGQSQITSPKMEVLYQSNEKQEEVGIVSINSEDAKNKDITTMNHIFADRRTDLYKDLKK